MTQDRKNSGGAWPNEGEGSRSGARAYDQATEKFAKSGKVDKKAHEASRSVDSPEHEELAGAEMVGKSHAKGEDPALATGAAKKP